MSKTYWLKDYVKVIKNNYSFDLTAENNNVQVPANTDVVYDIVSKYYTLEFFSSALKRYIYEYQDKWELIDSYYGHIKKYIFNQLVEELETKK